MTALVLFCLLAAPPYDPLAVDAASKVDVQVFTVKDATRSREIPIRVYLPQSKSAAPVVLFSHGLGGSRDNSVFLGEHWARRGYVAVFMQHPGSDETVWKGVAPLERLGAMKQAASVENFLLRAADVPAVLEALPGLLGTRADLGHVGMSGHSFGAVTTQAVSGQQFALGSFTEPRIKAAVAFSPSVPRRGTAEEAFGKVSTPWLLMTGTHDGSPIGDTTPQSRRGVFKALPAGSKYEVVFDGAEHSAFSDRALPGDSKPRNPNHHKVMLAFTTAFFDAYLRGDEAARAWLDGPKAKAMLEPKDAWQLK